ncbi:hypothetical protein Tco_1037329, partial [Tanacetum coccineum]
MVPVQVKTLKIQAGVQVSRQGELGRHLQLWKTLFVLYLYMIGTLNGNGNGNNEGHNSDGNENRNVNRRGDRPVARECTYQDFMKCQPLSFKRTKGVVSLIRWSKKMETVFDISNCLERYQV